MAKSWRIIATYLILISFIASGCGRYSEDVSGNKENDQQEVKDKTSEPEENLDEKTESPAPKPEEIQAVALMPFGQSIGMKLLYGYADKEMHTIIEPKFSQAEPFYSCGLAIAKDESDKTGLIDKTGKYVVEPDVCYFFYQDGLFLAFLSERNLTKVYDESGRLVFERPGYIPAFSDGLAVVYGEGSNGYIDKTGKMAIELPYENLGYFVDGIARVSNTYSGPSFFISKSGEDLTNQVSSGLRVYQNDETGLFGYKDKSGNIVIKEQFYEAEPFKDGYAVVNASEDYSTERYGIIDTTGNYVLEPKYIGVRRMRNGTFTVGQEAPTDDLVPASFMDYAPRSVYSKDLKESTPCIYFNIMEFDEAYLCVSDGHRITYLDASLNQAKDLPEFSGVGQLAADGPYLRGTINGSLSVADKEGNILMQDQSLVLMGDGLYTISETQYPQYYASICYPVLKGMKDAAMQNKINQIIQAECVTPWQPVASEEPYYFAVTYVDSYATRIKYLLHIDQAIEEYYLGAAHGAHYRKNVYINIQNGNTYALKDLFKSLDEGAARLSEIITAKMQANTDEYGYFDDHVLPDQVNFFSLTHDGITIYFSEYEIAPYSSGMPEFFIPYSDIMSLIDTSGEFWLSFH